MALSPPLSRRSTACGTTAAMTTLLPVNQALHFHQWVSIRSYFFSATRDEYVELTDATGEAHSTGRRLGLDAVKFVK